MWVKEACPAQGLLVSPSLQVAGDHTVAYAQVLPYCCLPRFFSFSRWAEGLRDRVFTSGGRWVA